MFRRRNLAILLFFTGIFILISCKGDDERRDYADGIESRMAPNQSMEISDARPLMSSKSMTPPFPQVISGTNNEVTERNSKEIQNIAADRISSTDETAESVSTTRMIIRNGSMEISVIEIESSIEYIKAAVAN